MGIISSEKIRSGKMSTFGPYRIRATSPTNGNNVQCNGPRTGVRYLVGNSNNGLNFVDGNVVNNYANQFYFEQTAANASTFKMYTLINGVKYYLTGSYAPGLSTTRSNVIYLGQGSPGGNMTYVNTLDGVNSLYIYYNDNGTREWLLTYIKNVFGSLEDNTKPQFDAIRNGNTPLTTDGNNAWCNYYFELEK